MTSSIEMTNWDLNDFVFHLEKMMKYDFEGYDKGENKMMKHDGGEEEDETQLFSPFYILLF